MDILKSGERSKIEWSTPHIADAITREAVDTPALDIANIEIAIDFVNFQNV